MLSRVPVLQSMRVLGDVEAWTTASAGAFTLRASFYALREVVFPSADFDRNSDRNRVSLPVSPCPFGSD